VRPAPGIQQRVAEIGILGGKPGPGRGKKTESNGSRLLSSNRVDYTLARLRRDRPDLAAKVIAGTMTAHAAAVEAGLAWRR
jgi:hypothetical protein